MEVINKTMERVNIDVNNLIEEYHSGKSVKALAKEFGVSRNVIRHRLLKNGIRPRNRSESMFNRMAHTSPEERKKLVSAANAAARNRIMPEETLHKIALARQKRVGQFEQEFIESLTNAGIPVNPQEPFLRYNLDIGCGNIAVEIHTQIANPLSKNFIKKLMECVHSGKNMLYVWISPRYKSGIVTDECYKQVISIVKACRTNPPKLTQYWVIRSTGELYTSGSFNFD